MKSEVGWVRPGTEYTIEMWVDWIPPKPADDADPRPLLVASITRSPTALSSPPRFCDTGTAEGRRCSPASLIRRRRRLPGPVEPAVSASLPALVRACRRRSSLPAVLRSSIAERRRDPTRALPWNLTARSSLPYRRRASRLGLHGRPSRPLQPR